jgi:hypothetical protein
MPVVNNDLVKYLSRGEAANYLNKKFKSGTRATLAKFATVGGGPKFRKFGRITLYTKEWLDDWAEARIGPPQSSTSDTTKEA